MNLHGQSEPRRLLLFISSLDGGGAQRVTTNLANHWAAKGWHVDVVTLDARTRDAYELHAKVRRIAFDLTSNSSNAVSGLFKNLLRLLRLRNLLRRFRPHVAIAMMTEGNVLLAIASIGVSRIVTIGSERIHPPQLPLGKVWEWLRKASYGRLSAVTVQTEQTARWVRQYTNAREVRVIPNLIVWPMPASQPRILPDSLIPAHRRLIIGVGRACAQKQFHLLLQSFFSVAGSYPLWDLAILGEGSLLADLKEQARMAGFAKRVLFPGRAGNLTEWYRRADIFVLSSKYEGFPNVLVEAMAHGVPPISFDCETGPRDIIRNGIDGVLVRNGDVGELTNAIRRLLDDDTARHALGKRASEIRDRLSIERISRMWEELFDVHLDRAGGTNRTFQCPRL